MEEMLYKPILVQARSSVFKSVAHAVVVCRGGDPGSLSESVHIRFVVDKVSLGQVLLKVLRFFPCQFDSTTAAHSSFSKFYPYLK
jgi:hypothetical protein